MLNLQFHHQTLEIVVITSQQKYCNLVGLLLFNTNGYYSMSLFLAYDLHIYCKHRKGSFQTEMEVELFGIT